FIAHGVIVGGAGVIIGSALGLAVVYAIREFNYPLDPKVYLISSLPAEISPFEFFVIAALGFLFTFLSTLYSATKASRLSIVDGLRK
ncbi:MAG: ABC transporter permease, partial [Deltaproteobacteria bacterium]|nr:ABC transporter permease [Deltaproteobacteria bacterium]